MTEAQKAWKRTGLSKRQLAKKLRRSFYTVYAWLRRPDSAAYRLIPEDELFRIKRLTSE